MNRMKTSNKELFDKYIYPELDFIGRLCRKYCMDKTAFSDLYNELLTNLFLYIHTYDPSKCIRPWLYVIVRREMSRLQRENARTPVAFVDLEGVPYSYIPVRDNGSQYEDIHMAINMLAPVHRDIVRLRLEGYKIKEIAAMMYARGCISADSRHIIKARLKESYH